MVDLVGFFNGPHDPWAFTLSWCGDGNFGPNVDKETGTFSVPPSQSQQKDCEAEKKE